MAHDEHEHAAESLGAIRCGLLTVTDSRTEATDESGALMKEMVAAAGHRVTRYTLLPNDEALVRAEVESWLDAGDIDAILITGGTGLSSRDRTIEAVRPLLEKELPGFGELFRALSFDEIGAAAIMSRATCGVAKGRVVVSLPGSKAAVRLALEKLLLPQLRHLVQQARK
ncbi:MAG: MogA/MoaB family molybdenum cofactor biosynthesis protein [Symbiobacteriia bacterium]